MSSVVVAVRVRPFNEKEKKMNTQLCVSMSGKSTTIISPDQPNNNKTFYFDYSLWSHDGYKVDENGSCVPENDKYTDQKQVYNLLGKQVVENAWQGFHCCLFAYGQTGAGKSYSMFGSEGNLGIIPMACEEIFQRINQFNKSEQQGKKVRYEVRSSMVELYNEKVQDLLVPPHERPPHGLKVRENRQVGFYVENLQRVFVENFKQIEEMIELCKKNRSISSTQMNQTSSRAHTILTIEFKKIETIDNDNIEMSSRLNLVDLAGSEKVSKTQAKDKQLKEAVNINKSLLTLGRVITILASKEQGKKNTVVPYRDSVLTSLLKNALGGNSKTMMICAISPAFYNYDETLSTLRYADSAKNIKNHATVNQKSVQAIIQEQKQEIEMLKQELEQLKNFLKNRQIDMNSNQDKDKLIELQVTNMQNMQEQIQAQENFLDDIKTKNIIDISKRQVIDHTKPYLINLHSDSQLNRKAEYQLSQPTFYVGTSSGNPFPQMILGGVGIQPLHAVFFIENDKVFIQACSKESIEYIYINGKQVQEKLQLTNNTRIIFGTSYTYLLKVPDNSNMNESDKQYTYDFAWEEFIQNTKDLKQPLKQNSNPTGNPDDFANQEVIQLKQQIEQLCQNHEQEIKNLQNQKNQESTIQQLENVFKQKQDELTQRLMIAIQLQKKSSQDDQDDLKYQEEEKQFIIRKLIKLLPKISQANIIAKELKKNVQFSIQLQQFPSVKLIIYNPIRRKQIIQILVNNQDEHQVYIWSYEYFNNRFFHMQDLLDKYLYQKQLPILKKKYDPFCDAFKPHIIGQVFISTKSVFKFFDLRQELTILGNYGPCGRLVIEACLMYDQYTKLLLMDDIMRDVQLNTDEELESKWLDKSTLVNIKIEQAFDLPEDFCRDTFCTYQFTNDQNELINYNTITIKGKNQNPQFSYSIIHNIQKIDQKLIKFIKNEFITIQVYGFEDINQPSKDNLPQIEEEQDELK